MRTNVLGDFPHPAVPELSYQLAGLSSREELIDASMEMLSRLISCDGIVWNAVDVSQGTVEVYGRPAVYTDPVWSEVLLQVDDHPMVASYLLKKTSTAPRRSRSFQAPTGAAGPICLGWARGRGSQIGGQRVRAIPQITGTRTAMTIVGDACVITGDVDTHADMHVAAGSPPGLLGVRAAPSTATAALHQWRRRDA
jgi:hypothetical protein